MKTTRQKVAARLMALMLAGALVLMAVCPAFAVAPPVHWPYYLGDVNNDGKVDTTDARLVLQYSAGRIDTFQVVPMEVEDVNGDRTVDSTDARLLLQYAAGRKPAFFWKYIGQEIPWGDSYLDVHGMIWG